MMVSRGHYDVCLYLWYSLASLVRGNRTGILFNNEMDDFSTPGTMNAFGYPASPSNFIVPGKMPQSSMSPSLFLDDEGVVRFSGGASGGSRIITSTSFVRLPYLHSIHIFVRRCSWFHVCKVLH